MRTKLESLWVIAAFGLWLGVTGASAQDPNGVPVVTNVVDGAISSTVVNVEATEPNPNDWMNEYHNGRGHRRHPMVVVGDDIELRAEDSADSVVVIGGNAKIHGKVRDDVVVIGGDIEVDGEVRGEVVALGGNIRLNGKAGREVVAILGGVQLGPEAIAGHDVVTVGGKLDAASGSIIRGDIQEIPIAAPLLPKLDGLKDWFLHCVLKLRPLAFQVPWVWTLWGASLLVYLLVAIALPRPVRTCANQLMTRPATTFLAGLLMNFLLPIFLVVLVMTGVGVLVIPFILAALVFGLILGKAALLEYVGERIGRQFGLTGLQQPLAAFALGAILITLLYLVPVLGLITLGVASVWSLGAVVAGAFAGMKVERPTLPAPPPPANPPTPAFTNIPTAINPEAPVAATAPPPGADPAPATPPVALPTDVPPALAFPAAGFWIRMGAGFLDAMLLCFAAALIANTPVARLFGPTILFLVGLAYFAGMWAWKGTTVGGVVLKLQVVRCDGGPVTFTVALVRALAGAFSVFALFLGIFWIGWNPTKQGWHDMIAGTAVVRLPHSMPLVCL